ncbi:MAG: 3-oxoacyl-ACP reductase FabG [Firmicutes bacterium]|nr:3-oxoacyl-ACP reductase FabG [Bacillota bacterium]
MVLGTPGLKGKVAIVTGGSRGIGRAISLAFGQAGMNVVVTSRVRENAAAAASEITQRGGVAVGISTDVGNPGDVARLVNEAKERYGAVDVLVNCAGISPYLKSTEKMTLEEWEEVLRTNLTGTFLCSTEVARLMIARQRGGSIISIASVGGSVALPRLAAYCAAKHGILGLTKVMAVDWAKYGIRVNAVAPAYVETDMTLAIREKSPKICEDLLRKTPLGRFAKPEEITGAVLYLASDAASYVTGQTLFVDGGWLAL